MSIIHYYSIIIIRSHSALKFIECFNKILCCQFFIHFIKQKIIHSYTYPIGLRNAVSSYTGVFSRIIRLIRFFDSSEIPYFIISIIFIDVSNVQSRYALFYCLIALQFRWQCIIMKYIINYACYVCSSFTIVKCTTSVIITLMSTRSILQQFTFTIIYLTQSINSKLLIIQHKFTSNAFTCHNHGLFANRFFTRCQPPTHFS